MKDKIFWSLLAILTLTGWNVSFAQRQSLDLIAEPEPIVQSPAQVRPAQRFHYGWGYTPLTPGAGLPAPFGSGQVLACPGFPMAEATAVEASDLLPSDARELLKRYETERATIQKEADQQVRARRQKLIEELKPLQDKYTREAKLDEAVAIRDLIRTLQEPVAGGEAGGFFYAPQRPGDQAAAGGEQDPVVAELRRVVAKLVAKGARGSWSPDGKRIALGKMPFGSGLAIVELTGRASGSPSRLPRTFVRDSEVGSVTNLLPDGKDPAWSPNGRWIAFTREVTNEGRPTEEIWLAPVGETSEGQPIVSRLRTGAGEAKAIRRRLGTGVMATWSADAKTVFFSNPQTREILSIRVDKPDAEPVVLWKAVGDQFPDLWYPVVRPDGRYVAYHADGRLKIADMPSQRIVGSWPLDGWRGWLGGWSPDGCQLGYGAFGGEDKGLWELSFIILGKPALSQPRRILSGSCTLPKARKVLLRGLQLEPDSEVMLYLARIMIREGSLCPEEVPSGVVL